MTRCFFASDLHGHLDRYEKLFGAVERDPPSAVFLGGDLLPFPYRTASSGEPAPPEFLAEYLAPRVEELRRRLGARAPRLFLILGNDDPRHMEPEVLEGERRGLWEYAHQRRIAFERFAVFGYACIPPTPFRLKDWERYDVSRHVDPGCVSPEEGTRTVDVPAHAIRYGTIAQDLALLTEDEEMSNAIVLLHAPPYRTALDLADLQGKCFEGVPLDEHIGSIAVSRFIEERAPAVTLHGHVHEAARLSGAWRVTLGRTVALGAAHDGPELALVRFDADEPWAAERELL